MAYNNLGVLYADKLKDYPKTEEFYQKAIEKEVWNAYQGLGILYRDELKDYSKAEEFFLKAIEKEVWNAYQDLGILYRDELKDYSKAEEFFLKAIEKEVWRAYPSLGNLYLEQNQLEEALKITNEGIEKVKKLLEKETKNKDYYATLAGLYSVLNDRDSFYLNLQKAVEYAYEMAEEIEDYPKSVHQYFEEEEFQALLKKSKQPLISKDA